MNDAEKKLIEKLYIEMVPKLYAYAKALLGDESLAEEAVQDTFRIACANIVKFEAHPNPKGWLMTTLKHVIQQIKACRARDVAILKKLSEHVDAFDPDAPPPDTDTDILYENLTGNPDYQLLKQYIEAQCTIAQFANILGISPDACAKRLQRARGRLKKHFENL